MISKLSHSQPLLLCLVFWHFLIFLVLLLLFFYDTGPRSVDQAGLTLRDPPASAGIKGVCHHGLTGFVLFLMALYLFS